MSWVQLGKFADMNKNLFKNDWLIMQLLNAFCILLYPGHSFLYLQPSQGLSTEDAKGGKRMKRTHGLMGGGVSSF